jgi:hypothetical protein
MTPLPVHKERLRTWKRCQIGKKSINRYRKSGAVFPNPPNLFTIYLRSAPPSGRNRDFAISGSQRKPSRAETVLDTTKFTITDE